MTDTEAAIAGLARALETYEVADVTPRVVWQRADPRDAANILAAIQADQAASRAIVAALLTPEDREDEGTVSGRTGA